MWQGKREAALAKGIKHVMITLIMLTPTLILTDKLFQINVTILCLWLQKETTGLFIERILSTGSFFWLLQGGFLGPGFDDITCSLS